MLSDECLQDGGPSDAPESVDAMSKKKKSFHPLRSLKRFFGHGGNSRRRSNNDDIADNSTVLLKARSTTDVVVVSTEAADEAECAFQRSSKQISLSADSIFSTERGCDSNLPVSAISSEALLHSESRGASSLLQGKDDDEGLPQSPCNLITTAELFIENGLKEDQSEKWPSFDSGHSLLSVDSNENEAEEDFFKEKWVSKSSLVNAGNETSGSPHDDLDLNLVQRHPSLISSAVIHRLAVRPKGKRVLSTYQQKLGATSLKLAVSGKSLPLVKEEGTKASVAENLNSSESRKQLSSSGNSLDAAQNSENEDSTSIFGSTEVPEKGDAKRSHEKSGNASSTKKVKTVISFEKVEFTRSSENDEIKKGFEKVDLKKSAESVAPLKSAEKIAELSAAAKSTEDVGQGETEVLQNEDLKREILSSRAESTTVNAEEESSKPVTIRCYSETSLSQTPPKKTTIPLTVVVVRQKPPRAVAPSAQEIQEMAARRQTLTYSGESGGAGVEKSVSKRSSMVIPPDRPVVPPETGNTELAQMFSKFQRRSSQKKQSETEDSKPPEDDNNNGRANENASQAATNLKPVFVQTASKEQVSLVQAVPGVKRSGKVVEVSVQGTVDSPVGLASGSQQIRVENSAKKVEKGSESNENIASKGYEKTPEKITEKSLEKTKSIDKPTVKGIEKTAERYIGRTTEKNMGKTTEKNMEKTKSIDKPTEKHMEKTRSIEKSTERNMEKTMSIEKSTERNMEKTKSIEKATERNMEKAMSIEKPTEKSLEKIPEKCKEWTIEKPIERTKEMNTELKIKAVDQKESRDIQTKSENVRNTSTPPSVSPDEKTKGVKKSYSISYKVNKSSAEKSQQGTAASIKTRSASQSEPMDVEVEVPTKTSFSQSSRRGSFTYTSQKDGRVKAPSTPISDIPNRTEGRAGTTPENRGRSTDVAYNKPLPPSVTTPSRPGIAPSSSGMVAMGSRSIPFSSGTIATETEISPSGSGSVPLGGSGMASSRVALTPDRSATVPLGSRVVPRVIVGPGAVRSAGTSGITSKESALPVAPEVTPTADKSLKDAKVIASASEKSSHQAASASKVTEVLINRDSTQLAPKASPGIRPMGGQRMSTGKEGENLVEWVGVARQKTRAWKEGKIDIADKMESCN